MSSKLPVQAFQIGQRVRHIAGEYFIIGVIYIETDLTIRYARNSGIMGSLAENLILAPERPPYVPSERRVVRRDDAHMQSYTRLGDSYRCETDDELAARHAFERAGYDRADTGEVVICDASGKPVGITGRTGQPGPDADDRQVCDYPICSTRGAGHPLACKCQPDLGAA